MALFLGLDARVLEPLLHRVKSPTSPEKLHVTVKFLGAADLESVLTRLDGFEHPACKLQVTSVEAYKGMVWARVKGCEELHGKVEELLHDLYAQDHPTYQPHVTLSRRQQDVNLPVGQEWLADKMILYESKDGQYEIIKTYNLTI